jgi:toxin ParE1/3/4
MRVILSEAAVADLKRQSGWYFEKAGERIAGRYLKAFDSTVSRIQSQPQMGTVRRFRDFRLQGLRSVMMDGAFRVHLVFFRVESDQLVVFRVLHGMRDLPKRLVDPPSG